MECPGSTGSTNVDIDCSEVLLASVSQCLKLFDVVGTCVQFPDIFVWTGKSQETCSGHGTSDNQNYSTFKASVLKAYELLPGAY